MSFVDFSQRAEDHTRIQILVLQINNAAKTKNFNKIYERITRLHTLSMPTTPPRVIRMRYRKYYAVENNAWGDFQVHRRVLGLLSIGHCEHEWDLAEILRQHEQQKEKYETTLLDSRLILFDSSIKTQVEDSKSSNGASHQSDSFNDGLTFDDPLRSAEVLSGSFYRNSENTSGANSGKPRNGTKDSEVKKNGVDFALGAPGLLNMAQTLQYASIDECQDLEDKIQEFLSSLFWVLESKRLDRSYEKLDHMTLLTAPFELRKAASVGDSESRVYKKRCQGRLKKHLGDLCLLAGVANESMLHYQTSIELLKATNDSLWLAGAYEGLSSASVVLLKPRGTNQQSMQRISSFSLKRGVSAAKEAKTRPGGMSSSLQLTPNGLDLATESHQADPGSLPEDILENYKEAVINYSKFKEAGVVEMEASIKACRVLVEYQRQLAAADFLQNIVYINVPLMEEEKIQRFLTLASLYNDIRMYRKAAFYSRIAAMQCVSGSNQHPSWSSCYQLLLQALPGYQLSLDPKDMQDVATVGWTSLQLRVMHELVYSARRMGNSAVAIRSTMRNVTLIYRTTMDSLWHLSFLLHTMFNCLSVAERVDLAGVLKTYTNKCESTALSIALDDGTILPPVPFTRFPILWSLTLLPVVPHHRPVKFRRDRPLVLSPVVKSTNPFIYTPLFISSASGTPSKLDILWVEGDLCEAAIRVSNPLPFDIDVTNLGLMTEGVEVTSLPSNFLLPAGSHHVQTRLQLVPRACGKLTITGYITLVIGVKNHCKLRDLRHKVDLNATATVVPVLPLLQVTTSLPKSSSFSTMTDSDCVVSDASLSVYAGQSVDFQLDFLNTSKSSVERIDLLASSNIPKDLLDALLSWNEEHLQSQMPISPDKRASILVNVKGVFDFISMDLIPNYPPKQDLKAKFGNQLSSFRRYCSIDTATGILSVEVLLLIQYSGGAGLELGYCRQCSVSLTIDILPSILFEEYMVTHSNSVGWCNLIFAVANATPNDIELVNGLSEYQLTSADDVQDEGHPETHEKHVLIVKGGQTSRFSVRIPSVNDIDNSENVRVCSPTLEVQQLATCSNDIKSLECFSQAALAQHVASFVDIRWKMFSTEVSGGMSLEAVDWTSSQCSLLRYCPLTCAFEIDGERTAGGVVKSLQCSQVVRFACTATNCSDYDLENVELGIVSIGQTDVFPSLINESTIMLPASGDKCAAVIGTPQSCVARVPCGSGITHSCSLLFTHPGLFHISCRCRTSSRFGEPSESARPQWPYLVSVSVSDDVAEQDLYTST